MATILSDFLTRMQVPHTATASDDAFRKMPFQSLFGFGRLLKSYGVDSRALSFSDKKAVRDVPVPFLAQKKDAFVIVTEFTPAGDVCYQVFGRQVTQPFNSFTNEFTGVVLQAFPTPDSAEPDYRHNRIMEIIGRAKTWILWLCVAFLVVFAYIADGYAHGVSTTALLLVDIAGITVTWMLILKTLNIKNRYSDRICSIIREHGCETVLARKASSFFGIFFWSEVGISYFAISTLILLLYPGALPVLTPINACCLPFTFWSVWYQKFRARTWCTLCLTTQALLWLQFGAYLWSGGWHDAWPPDWLHLVLAGSAYAAALLAVNRLMNFIKSRK